MDWRRARQSDNVVRAPGGGLVRAGGGLGLGGLVRMMVIGIAMGRSPLAIVSLLVIRTVRDGRQEAVKKPFPWMQTSFAGAVVAKIATASGVSTASAPIKV